MMTRYTYDRTAARPDPKKPLSQADRDRMANEREAMLEDDPEMSGSERREIEQEIKLLRNRSIEVGFNGTDVVRIATGLLPPSLGRRSGWELRIIGELSDIFPFQVSHGQGNDEVDMLAVAAGAVDTMKRKHADLWNGMMEVNMTPKAVADIMVSVMLSERRQFQAYRYDRTAAKTKHPAIVAALIAFLKDGPFKSYLRLKVVRADKAVLIPQGLNAQVERVEISGLQGDKAEFVLFLTNGDSGWAWDEWRQPPKFHNDPGYNVIHLDKLDRMANPQTDPAKFEQHMMSLCKGALVPAIQRAGWVIDPATKKPTPLAQWLKMQPAPAAPLPSAKPSPTPTGGGWSRTFLDAYRTLEKYLRVQGDAEGVDLLEAFGRRAEDLNAFGSARLSMALRAIENRLRATKDTKGLQLLDVLGAAFDDMVERSQHEEDPYDDDSG